MKGHIEQLRSEVQKRLRYTATNWAIVIFALTMFALMGLLRAYSNELVYLPEFIVAPLQLGVVATSAYLAASIISRLTGGLVLMVLKDADIEHKLLVRKAYSGLIYAIATLFILWRLGLTATNLTVLVGFIATGFAFAVRDVVLAYLAWYVLLTKRPFRIGDYIKIGEDEGKVLHIGTFYVLIDNSPETREDFVRIPGRVFLEKPITNYGSQNPMHTLELSLESVTAKTPAMLVALTKRIKRDLGVTISAKIDGSAEKRFVRITFRTPYEKKADVTQAIILGLARR